MLKDIFTTRKSTTTTPARQHFAENPYLERVVLPDGEVMLVARGSLVAAKAVVAARKAALRRMAEHKQYGREIVFLEERARKDDRSAS